jgi:hypothetical protein
VFWNNPEGAEAILQVRAAARCDDDRLSKHLCTRSGHLFTRRPKTRKVTAEKTKADVHLSVHGQKALSTSGTPSDAGTRGWSGADVVRRTRTEERRQISQNSSLV